jgi:transcriptional regulator NrdR family protein
MEAKMVMRKHLTVVKSDGSAEEYLHTKVIGAISKALSEANCADVYLAEQLADAVTYYLYNQHESRTVTSGEIFSIIKAVLTSTGYDDAALVLNQYHLERRLKRCRIEVVYTDPQELADSAARGQSEPEQDRVPWDKSHIVEHLVTERHIDRQVARAIAAMVEEVVFNLGLSSIPSSLIEQLVLNQTAAVLRAEQQFLMAV